MRLANPGFHVLVALFVIGCAAGTADPAASARTANWCTETGDTCRNIILGKNRVIVEAFTPNRVRGTVSLCVSTPYARSFCRSARFRVTRYGSSASLALPLYRGVYRLETYGSRTVSLRVARGPRPRLVRRVCPSVPAPGTEASTVVAYNMGCAAARSLVRRTVAAGRRAPAGWRHLNPAGCEGYIVRRADAAWVMRHGNSPRPGRPAVSTTIIAGCGEEAPPEAEPPLPVPTPGERRPPSDEEMADITAAVDPTGSRFICPTPAVTWISGDGLWAATHGITNCGSGSGVEYFYLRRQSIGDRSWEIVGGAGGRLFGGWDRCGSEIVPAEIRCPW